jgi:hypothetical protein
MKKKKKSIYDGTTTVRMDAEIYRKFKGLSLLGGTSPRLQLEKIARQWSEKHEKSTIENFTKQRSA